MSIGKNLLYYGKGSHYYVHTVIRMKSSRAYQIRAERNPRPIGKLRNIHDIRHNPGVQSEFAKYLYQISGRHHQPVRLAKKWPCRAESAQVIPGLPAVIMNQHLLLSQSSDQPRWHGRDEERPIRGREDVDDVHIFHPSPQVANIHHFSH